MSMTRQENDVAGIVLFEPEYEQNLLEHGAAETIEAGTVLARNSVSGNLGVYDAGGINGLEIPLAVLQNEVAHDGVTDTPINAIIGGQVRRPKLVAHSVGALTQAEVDALRDYGVVARATTELSEYDN